MVLYKCAKCGAGELEPLGDGKKAMCVYCNSVMVLPTLDPEAFNQANELRKEKKFDQAEMAFQRIISEYPQDSESYWNLVLCRYGIEYVEEKDEDDPDGAVRNYVPTCHRMSYDSILKDPDYQKALTYADGYSYRLYEEEAKKIDRILKRAAYIAQTQPAYDIFISYKESERSIGNSKDRTEDSVIAQEIYDELKRKHPNLNVFLSRVTLSQVAAGLEYEPIIFSALNSAKLMILVGTSKENLESTWVKNEWSRYRKMMGRDVKKAIAVVYRGMNPKTDFPEELRMHAVQGTEARGIYLPDFIAGVEEYLGIKAMAEHYEAAQIYEASTSRQVANLCLRAEQSLDMNKIDDAKGYLEKALDIDPQCARVWWGMVLLGTKNLTYIDSTVPIMQKKGVGDNWNMVQRYAKGAERSMYERNFGEFKERWDLAYKKYAEKRDLESKQSSAASKLAEIKNNTKNGTYFKYYQKYNKDSEFAETLRALFRSYGAEKELKEFEEFEEMFASNYEKFLELQKLKGTYPVKKIEESSDYQILKKEKEKFAHKLEKTKKGMNGVFFYVVLIAAAVAGFCAFAASGHEKAIKMLDITIYVVPLLSLLMVFSVIIDLFAKKKSVMKNASDSAMHIFTHMLIALIPTIGAYFYIQYQLFLAAKSFDTELQWTCILAGLLYLVYGIVIIIAVILLVVNFVTSIIFLAVMAFIANMIPGIDDIKPISEEILVQCYKQWFEWLALAAIAVVVVRLIMYFANKAAVGNFKTATSKHENAANALDDYKKDMIKKMKQPYLSAVASEYLEDMEKKDI